MAAFALYALGAVVVTWPLVLHLDSSWFLSPDRPVGDYTSVIAHTRELVEGGYNPFAPGRVEAFNTPNGTPILWVINIAQFVSTIVLYALALVFGATAGVGLFVLGGFAFSALAMFLLVRKLTGNAWVALIAGWAFGFYPFIVANGEHPLHMHGWPLVLLAWRMLELREVPTVRNGLLAGAATVIAMAWTPYYILLGGVAYVAVAATTLGLAALRGSARRHLVPQVAAGAVVLGFLVVVRALAVVDADAAATATSSNLEDLFLLSARPLMFLLPPEGQPVAGGWGGDQIASRGWGGAEKQLYVGWTVVLLAAAGAAFAVAGRTSARLRGLSVVAIAVVLLGAAFAGPPQVGIAGQLVPLPPYFVHEIVPSWRLYSRFVIVVMLGLVLLAAFGLARLSQIPRWGPVVLALAAVLVPLDLWARHDDRVRRVTEPSIYATLRAQQDDKAVAEYPISPTYAAEDYDDLYRARFHDRPLLNGWPPRSDEESRALDLVPLEDPNTAGQLSLRGVGYVVLRNRRPTAPAILPSGEPGRGFELIDRDGFGRLYRVRADRPFVQTGTGFGAPEGAPGDRVRWMYQPASSFVLHGRCSRGCVFSFRSESFKQPRVVTVRDADGRRLARKRVEPSGTRVRVPVRFDEQLPVTITTDPGPQRISPDDPRTFAINVRDQTLEPAGRRRGGL